MSNSLSIGIEHPRWIKEGDDPFDLCSHGDVEVSIGGDTIIKENDVTTSAAGLQLLRTLTENHATDPSKQNLQLFPHCGHAMFVREDSDDVEIVGCDLGADLAITHDGEMVIIEAKDGSRHTLSLEDYRRAVLSFVDEVERFYDECAPKQLPDDDVACAGYEAFWSEWNRRKNTA